MWWGKRAHSLIPCLYQTIEYYVSILMFQCSNLYNCLNVYFEGLSCIADNDKVEIMKTSQNIWTELLVSLSLIVGKLKQQTP